MKKMFLIRGVPGSGKTTFAKKLVEKNPDYYHIETDQYWIRPDGIYDFNFKYLHEAHTWCHKMSSKVCFDMKSIIISNTFTTLNEMLPYINLASEFHYNLYVIRCNKEYGSIHDVPENAIEKMKNRFEDFIGEIYVEDYQ